MDDGNSQERGARALLVTTVVLVTLAALPVLVRGAPLADDYSACLDVGRRGS